MGKAFNKKVEQMDSFSVSRRIKQMFVCVCWPPVFLWGGWECKTAASWPSVPATVSEYKVVMCYVWFVMLLGL